MSKPETLIKLRSSVSVTWPGVCSLCLGNATQDDSISVPGEKIPYCDGCLPRVRRLQNWKDNLFGISLVIGVVFGILSLIGVVAQENWLALLRLQTYILAMAGGLIFMGAAYGLLWIMILPLRLILSSRLSAPAVREVKSKEPGVRRPRFANAEYAVRFREENAGVIIG
jgi:hypothetical protein